MAQVTLAAVGTAIAGPIGGAIGGAIGAGIDRTVINSLSPARQVGPRLTGIKLTQASEGDPVGQVFGRARVAGTLIWAARLKENRNSTRASKSAPKTESYSYSLSFAIGLCEGPIDGIGRIWADGQLLDRSDLPFRFYKGDEDQTPDALIESIEGDAPAYRGLSYMVFEDLDITRFGNRPPNLSVEVFRRPRAPFDDLESLMTGVCLIPGAGEFVYATAPNAVREGLSRARYETQNAEDGRTDFMVALDALQAALPNVKRVNLVVSWFGDDLRCGHCRIRPGVESADRVTTPLTWSVAGVTRDEAYLITQAEGRPVYGGTPDDASVVAAIRELNRRGFEVTLIPFILMDIPAGNGLPDPYGGSEQAAFPWRGRNTCDIAPGRVGSADQTAAITADVAAFFGTADDWGLRRFVRHVAGLGVQAGGVAAVLLGSELRGLTTLRSDAVTYPAVAALRDLAADVRVIVGDDTKVSYGADWSEYFGYQPSDGSGDVAFHLDPLWADENIDFVGIDWYAPLTDWRDGETHADYAAANGSIYDEAYLQSRIRGGEGFDWYYASQADRDAQIRSPITDGAYGESWIYRPKDVLNWWANAHHDRPGGVRNASPTAWTAQLKPIRFIEYGCAAIDKGPNAPNLFLDPKSSESHIPPYSSGARDDAAQAAYLMAMAGFYADVANNPLSAVYHAPMVEGMDAWAYDARPYPYFPARSDLWGDAGNWRTGHWLNGRTGAGDAKNLIAEICAQAGVGTDQLELSEVEGRIESYALQTVTTAESALTPVLSYLGLEVAERGGKLAFISTRHGLDHALALSDLALPDKGSAQLLRRELVEVPASLSVRCYDLERDYQLQALFVRRDDIAGASQAGLDVSLGLTHAQARAFGAHSLTRMQGVRHSLTLDLEPLDLLRFEVGDTLTLEGDATTYRLVRVDQGERPRATLQPVPEVWRAPSAEPVAGGGMVIAPPIVTAFDLIDLPPMGDSGDVRPLMLAASVPFAGVDAYAGAVSADLTFRGRIDQPASFGRTLMALPPGRGSRLLRQAFFDVYLEGDAPSSQLLSAVRAGANRLAVKADNGEWEVLQFLTATAIGVDQWRLSGLIRGQYGTDQARLAGAASGALVALLPQAGVEADLKLEELGLERLWRAGRSGFGGGIGGALETSYIWQGLGLRPRAPVHGRVRGEGDLGLSWIRCARYGGDGWEAEPPLGEATEVYRLRFCQGTEVRREVSVNAPMFTYDAAMQATDYPAGLDGDSYVIIAQVSAVVGAGAGLRVGLGG